MRVPPPVDTKRLLDLIDHEEGDEGLNDKFSPVTIREQRVARARQLLGLTELKQDRGDQVDQAVAEDHRTIDVSKVLQLLRSPGDRVIRKALQRLHVKWYHCETERLQSILRAAGVPAKVCNLVPQVVQASQVRRPWERPGQSNKLIYAWALACFITQDWNLALEEHTAFRLHT